VTKIKICGITSLSDAKAAVALGADAVGLNFYEKSPRAVSIAQAQTIIRSLPATVWKVGVFVNHSRDAVEETARKVGLDTLQFHGDEDWDFCAAWNEWRVIKAIRIGESIDFGKLEKFQAAADLLLFDFLSKSAYGGTGKQISDDSLQALYNAGYLQKNLLSGGLNVENVEAAVRKFHPYGVDVASGVESSPGVKDCVLVEKFIELVRKVN